MKKMLFIIFFILLIAVLALLLEKEGEFRPKVDLGENSYMDDVSITQRKDGAVRWIMSSKKAIFVNNNDVKLVGLKITFPEKKLRLNSDGGLYDIEKRNLKIEGNIKASTRDYDILSDKLYWDSGKDELTSDQRVRIIGRKFYVEGDGLNANNDKATLNNNVKAIFYYERK